MEDPQNPWGVPKTQRGDPEAHGDTPKLLGDPKTQRPPPPKHIPSLSCSRSRATLRPEGGGPGGGGVLGALGGVYWAGRGDTVRFLG